MRRIAELALLFLLCALPCPGADPIAEMTDYVQEVGDRLSSRQAAVGGFPLGFEVVETPAVAAGTPGRGVIQITTGFLASLESEAQLANVLAYEQARFVVRESRRQGPTYRTHVGNAAARGAAAGAAGAVVGVAVGDALKGTDRYIRAAGTGAAVGATTAAVWAAMPRRMSRDHARTDDRAAAEGMRVLLATGYDGAAALQAWRRAQAAAGGGGPEGGYGDRKANRKREKAQRKILKQAGARSEGLEGVDRYRKAVLERLPAGSSP